MPKHQALFARLPLLSTLVNVVWSLLTFIVSNYACATTVMMRNWWTNHLRPGQLAIDELNWPQRCLKFTMVRKRRSTPLEHCHAMLQELSEVQWNCCTTARHMFLCLTPGYRVYLLSPEVARSRNLEYLSFYDLCLAYLERPQPSIKQKWH